MPMPPNGPTPPTPPTPPDNIDRVPTEIKGVAYLTKYNDPRKRAQDAIEMIAIEGNVILNHWTRESGDRKPSMREFRNAANQRREGSDNNPTGRGV